MAVVCAAHNSHRGFYYDRMGDDCLCPACGSKFGVLSAEKEKSRQFEHNLIDKIMKGEVQFLALLPFDVWVVISIPNSFIAVIAFRCTIPVGLTPALKGTITSFPYSVAILQPSGSCKYFHCRETLR